MEYQGGEFPEMDVGGGRVGLCSLQSHFTAPASQLVSVATIVNHSPPAEEFLWLEALAVRLLTVFVSECLNVLWEVGFPISAHTFEGQGWPSVLRTLSSNCVHTLPMESLSSLSEPLGVFSPL